MWTTDVIADALDQVMALTNGAGGRTVFDRTCSSCHIGATGTDNNNGTLHAAAETGVNDAYAARTRNKSYRTVWRGVLLKNLC
jgi:hypothetical protein